MKLLPFIVLMFLFPLSVKAVVNLSINPQDIRFSEPLLIAGDEVRIYAKIYNIGDEDVSGYVSFYQGSSIIGDSLVISLPVNGNAEEVYIDFVVPERSFNILAVIQATDPPDVDSNNDSALTSIFTPVLDDDRDGVENRNDNCISTLNDNQLDTDGDGQGDACDEDDDGDSLSDDVEAELGTNTTQVDSDSDGVQDADDAYPNDDSKNFVGEETAKEEDAVSSLKTEAFQKIVEEVARTIKQKVEKPTEEESSEVTTAQVHVSPNAVFSYTQNDWDTFTFTVLTNAVDQAIYVWDFGDGVFSSKPSVQHEYNTSGAFRVKFTTTYANGGFTEEETTVFVPFFSLKNRLVLASVILLVILLLVGLASFFRLGKKVE